LAASLVAQPASHNHQRTLTKAMVRKKCEAVTRKITGLQLNNYESIKERLEYRFKKIEWLEMARAAYSDRHDALMAK
jgi:hypothetical protein